MAKFPGVSLSCLVLLLCPSSASLRSLTRAPVYTLFRRMVFYRGGWLVLCRFAVCDALLMALRATTVATTSLNNPWPFCNACGIADGCPETLWGAVVYTVQRFPTYDCGDTIFSHASASAHPAPPRLPLHSSPPWLVSPLLWLNLIYILRSLTVRSGHTVHFLLMGLIWATYPAESSSAWSVRAEVAAVWGAVVAGITLLISCRFHYSIDVLIAIYLTLPVWSPLSSLSLEYYALVLLLSPSYPYISPS